MNDVMYASDRFGLSISLQLPDLPFAVVEGSINRILGSPHTAGLVNSVEGLFDVSFRLLSPQGVEAEVVLRLVDCFTSMSVYFRSDAFRAESWLVTDEPDFEGTYKIKNDHSRENLRRARSVLDEVMAAFTENGLKPESVDVWVAASDRPWREEESDVSVLG